MAVSDRSDFLAYHNFPEVYHAQGISKAAIPLARTAPSSRIEYIDKLPSRLKYRVQSRFVSQKFPGVVSEDPELRVFGSEEK